MEKDAQLPGRLIGNKHQITYILHSLLANAISRQEEGDIVLMCVLEENLSNEFDMGTMPVDLESFSKLESMT